MELESEPNSDTWAWAMAAPDPSSTVPESTRKVADWSSETTLVSEMSGRPGDWAESTIPEENDIPTRTIFKRESLILAPCRTCLGLLLRKYLTLSERERALLNAPLPRDSDSEREQPSSL